MQRLRKNTESHNDDLALQNAYENIKEPERGREREKSKHFIHVYDPTYCGYLLKVHETYSRWVLLICNFSNFSCAVLCTMHNTLHIFMHSKWNWRIVKLYVLIPIFSYVHWIQNDRDVRWWMESCIGIVVKAKSSQEAISRG